MTSLKDRVRVLRHSAVHRASGSIAAADSAAMGLPNDLTSFVGRRAEASQLRRELGTARIVTLTGTGGMGKTRLALHVARLSRKSFTHGVHFIELAHLTDPDLVAQAIADCLSLTEQQRLLPDPIDAVVEYLRDRQVLLIIDNCEHLVDRCAYVAQRLLERLSGVRILATSRQALGVQGERVVPLPPMSVGDDIDHEVDNSALGLLIARASGVLPSFTLTPQQRPIALQLCRQLEGIPLAIELAGAQLRIYSLDELAHRLEHRLLTLDDTNHSHPERHRSLRATLDWSFELCTEEERTLWARSSVFCGGFYLDSVEFVCGYDVLANGKLVEALSGLLDKSVIVREEREGRIRFKILETLREYGMEKLPKANLRNLRYRHRQWYTKTVDRLTAEWFGPSQRYWSSTVRHDHANFRAAMEFCLAEADESAWGLHLVGKPWFLWAAALSMAEHRHWLTRALEEDRSSSDARAMALATCGLIAILQGDRSCAARLLDEGRHIASLRDDDLTLACVTHFQGLLTFFNGDLIRGEELLLDGYARYQEFSTRLDLIGTVEMHLGLLYVFQGKIDTALLHLTRLRERSAERGESWLSSYAYCGIGLCLLVKGQLSDAKSAVVAGLEMKTCFDDSTGVSLALEVLAWITTAERQWERAATLFGAAAQVWQSFGPQLYESERWLRHRQEYSRLVRNALGIEAFEQSFAEGARLEKNEVLGLVLGKPRSATAKLSSGSGVRLTPREREVAGLVARGCSNREIAEELVISHRTVEGHVENILRKLGVVRRTQIAVLYGISDLERATRV
jgi:predicted ATPase/DNA-binding CsgD family transcriptional regulator